MSLKLFSVIPLLSLAASAAILLPDPNAVNVPCGTRAVLSQYMAPGATGCIVGDKEFSNFQTIPGSAELPGTWNINILDVGTGIFQIDVARASPVLLTGPFPRDFGFQYDVKVINSENVIHRTVIAVNPGGGSSTVSKTIFDLTGGILGASLGSGTTLSNGAGATIDLIPPSQWVRVVERIHATDGLLSSFTDVLFQEGGESSIPEPATYAMVGTVLLGLAYRRRVN